ncbi:unnamed protein product, partial [Meganyctiphanes norvegica]
SGCEKEMWIENCQICICSRGTTVCTNTRCGDDLGITVENTTSFDNTTTDDYDEDDEYIDENYTISPEEYELIEDRNEVITLAKDADLPEGVNKTEESDILGEQIQGGPSFMPLQIKSCELGFQAKPDDVKYVFKCEKCNYCEDSCRLFHVNSCKCKKKFRCKKGTKG